MLMNWISSNNVNLPKLNLGTVEPGFATMGTAVIQPFFLETHVRSSIGQVYRIKTTTLVILNK